MTAKSVKDLVKLFNLEYLQTYGTHQRVNYGSQVAAAKAFLNKHWPNKPTATAIEEAELVIRWFFGYEALHVNRVSTLANLSPYYSDYQHWINRVKFKEKETVKEASRRDIDADVITPTLWDELLNNLRDPNSIEQYAL